MKQYATTRDTWLRIARRHFRLAAWNFDYSFRYRQPNFFVMGLRNYRAALLALAAATEVF